MRHVGKNWSY